MSNTAGMPVQRFSRRKLLLGGVVALGMGGVGMACRGFSQQASNTSLEPTRLQRDMLYTYRGHSSAVFSVGWSPDGTSIASGSTDTTVQVWDAFTGGHVLTYRGHTQPVLTAAWSPDGTTIASGGEDSLIQVWDAATGSREPRFVGKKYLGIINSLAWSPDGASLAVGGSKGVYVVDVPTARFKHALLDTGIVLSVAWSPDGKSLALGTDEKVVLICDAMTGNWKLTYSGHTSIVNAVAWSPDGTSIASGGFDRTVQVWNATTGARNLTYRGHTNYVNSLA